MTLILIALGVFAGGLGSMLGIGGGMILVPALALLLKVPLAQAVPASLMCVVASSCGAAANYVEQGMSDVRLAMTLELATVSGAIFGGLVAAFIAPKVIFVAFGLFALYVAVQLLVFRAPEQRVEHYEPTRWPLGVSGSFVAGSVSAVLGVGGGPIKVPLMAFGMKVPFKVASATSNLMIGVTGVASVAAYAFRGHLDLALISPLVVGVLAGAMVGSRFMHKVPTEQLKRIFALVLLVIAAEMLWKGGKGLWPIL